MPSDLTERLSDAGQPGVMRFWNELDDAGRKRLAEQVASIDLELIRRLYQQHRDSIGAGDGSTDAASRAAPPSQLVRQPKSQHEHEEWHRAMQVGEEMLAAGKVAAIVVAGGQGTRLGFDKPKGMFRIGPVSGASLFQILAEQLLARGRRAGCAIPYYVMTSDATHHATEEFFRQQHHFGLDPGDVLFFRQGNMPAVDAATGELLLADRDRLALSPDGHGGLLTALQSSGALADMKRRGIEYLYYHQVDNPTAIICDPALLGWHALQTAEITTKVVAKVSPTERMGVVCDVAGKTQIIEYSDLPESLADTRDASGEPVFWAGNTAIHVMSRTFLDRLCDGQHDLPFHIARKKVPYLDETGRRVDPDEPNAIKFERFIFDALPLATRSLVVEADRSREFNPVKNAEGSDSPATARAALDAIGKAWLRAAGGEVADDAVIEISPLYALDDADVARKVKPGTRYEGDVYLRD